MELHETIKGKAYELEIPFVKIPEYITKNIKYGLFKWQKEAIKNFLLFEEIKKKNVDETPYNKDYTHLMFNMGTGTGKTLVMACLILYYYQKGYRNFLFFVNQNNIVDKTENNFIDENHSKYLFSDKIDFDGKTVSIKKVENFSDNCDDICIKFTSVQKLYSDIHLEKENNITLEQLYNQDIVMLGDEAHSLNTDTRRRTGEQEDLDLKTKLKTEEEIARKGWEDTVRILILKKNGKESKNVLLEFTATIPTVQSVAEKYADKKVYKFGLKDFLQAGYTKEINLVSASFDKKERILHTLLFNWYRHKIALKHKIHNFKGVILFRSKKIEESKDDYKFFIKIVNELKVSDFDFLKSISEKIDEKNTPYEQGKSRTEDILKFIKANKIKKSEIVSFVKDNFLERNLIITNSKDGTKTKENTSEEQEKLLNNLEDKNNHIRAIFTVKRLTEGWDVLNLFDIVRLYEGQNTGGGYKGKTPEATISEKQLIGRGVRYYPFSYKEKQKNKRKFDDDLKNELRVLEELYYYTCDDSEYISELKKELKKDGYITDDKVVKSFNLKEEFKESDFYKKVKIWKNEQEENPDKKKKNLQDLAKDFFSLEKISGILLTEEEMHMANEEKDTERLNLGDKKLKTISINFGEFEKNVFNKAVNIVSKKENSFYRFDNLKEKLGIDKIDDLRDKKFLGDFEIKIVVGNNIEFENIENEDKLKILIKFLKKVEEELKTYINDKIGTEFKAVKFCEIFDKGKVKNISKENIEKSETLARELKDSNWYVLNDFVGTLEENALVELIKESVGNLEEKYKEFYLLRNEEVYKIYDFESGRGFQPDFILFLKGGTDGLYYQIFIEPKGNQYLGEDKTFDSGKEGWKNIFLKQILKKYGDFKILEAENENYKLIGLPFFNKKNNEEFEKEFEKILQSK